jgi:hypothetical protein
LDIPILDFGLVSNFVLGISNFVARKNREQNLRFRMDNGLTGPAAAAKERFNVSSSLSCLPAPFTPPSPKSPFAT